MRSINSKTSSAKSHETSQNVTKRHKQNNWLALTSQSPPQNNDVSPRHADSLRLTTGIPVASSSKGRTLSFPVAPLPFSSTGFFLPAVMLGRCIPMLSRLARLDSCRSSVGTPPPAPPSNKAVDGKLNLRPISVIFSGPLF